jgi:molybdenum cofactor cytidylyltransferase
MVCSMQRSASVDLDCVIVAAGESRRMGDWKLLLPWGPSTVVQTTVQQALIACGRVILVTGYRGDELERLFGESPQVVCIRNPRFRDGMFSSIQSGVSLVKTGRFFICLADMPLITPDIYRALASADPAPVVRPFCGGQKGHPVLLSSTLIGPIQANPSSGSMADVISRQTMTRVETSDSSVYVDIDQPAEYQRLRPR